MFTRKIFHVVSWKVILFLATLACLFQIINITLSWYIQTKQTDLTKYGENRLGSSLNFSNSAFILWKHINQWKVLDSSREFNIVVGVLKGSNWNSDAKLKVGVVRVLKNAAVTLVTHCSLQHINLIPELATRWQGPVSVAVFLLNGELKRGLEAIISLHLCFQEVKANVTFSLVFPVNSSIYQSYISENAVTSCDSISGSLSLYNRTNYEVADILYPNNLLRNTAREIITTPYIIVLDIDFVPSAGLHSDFSEFVNIKDLPSNYPNGSTHEYKTVWVLPSYEIDDSVSVPDDKASLLSYRKNGYARPFYQELCWKCQKHTKYDAWESIAASKHKPNFASNLLPVYEVAWKDPWEPFYIARSSVPFYDERFRQYGFNRISQVCELHVSGYKFLVLNSAFVVHRGFKRKGSLHSSKDKEQEANRLLFRQFKEDLKKKYPESPRRCY